jgi:hypothetical protein
LLTIVARLFELFFLVLLIFNSLFLLLFALALLFFPTLPSI